MSDMNTFNPEEQPGNAPERPAQTTSEGMPTVRLTNVPQSQDTAGDGRWGDVAEDWREVGDEFKKLGVRLASAIRAGWRSDQAQQQQLSNLGDQLRAMADQVEASIRSARQEAQAPETKAQVGRVVEAAKGAQATLVDELRDTIARSLRTLNAQLRDLAERIEPPRK